MIPVFKNLNDFIEFFHKHPEIKTRTQFKKEYPKLYGDFLFLKLNKIIKDEEFPLKTKRVNYNLNLSYKTKEDFQKYIDENNIRTVEELKEMNISLYNRLCRLHLQHEVVFKDYVDPRYYNTWGRIQKLIIEKEIISRVDLKYRYIQVYRTYCSLRKEDPSKDVVFCRTRFESSYEAKLYHILEENRIYFKTQQYIGTKFRYDFVDYTNKIIVEVHGRQHFGNCPEIWNNDNNAEEIKEKDKEKKKEAELKGFRVLYFTFNKLELNKFGYFTKVYTEVDELIHSIKDNNYIENESPKKEKYSMLKMLEEFEKEEKEKLETRALEIRSLEDLNTFLQENKISSPHDFKKNYSKLHSKAERFNWINKIKYYTEPGKVGTIKNYRDFKDFQEFIIKFKVRSRKEFRLNYCNIYHKARDSKFIDDLIYYSE